MNHSLKASLVLLATLTLGACSTPNQTDITQSVWYFPVNQTKATLQFVNDTKISGFTGCNAFQGSVKKDNDRYQFVNDLALTLKLCGAKENQIESKILDWLSKTDYFRVQGNELVFYDKAEHVLTRLTQEKKE